MIQWRYDDGGRLAAGFKGVAGDCVCRALAIASERPYREIYERLADGQATQRITAKLRATDRRAGQRTADHGINYTRLWFKRYVRDLGFRWVPTMGIGTGCRVHLTAAELPPGRLVVALSKHYAAVIDQVLHDLSDVSRGGTRCVYGYWIRERQ